MLQSGIRRRLRVIVAVSAVVFVTAAAAIVIDGLTDDIHHADVAVVLGNKVEDNGQPSDRLCARLDRAVDLFEGGMFSDIIVSGATGKEGFDEAVVMKQYLIEQGVPPEHIHEDSEGATTYLTAMNSSRIMNQHGWHSAMVITQYFHISRSRLALERFGIMPVYTAHADFFELRDPYSILREVAGYGVYLLRDYPSPSAPPTAQISQQHF
jgi:vancomycin permeability regulator SanA